MKLLLDQNISYRIIKHLPSTISATHVTNEGLVNSADFEIWQFAKSNGYTIEGVKASRAGSNKE